MRKFPGIGLNVFLTLISMLGFLFWGCSSSQKISDSNVATPSENPEYSLVYLIHGDANYLYHENGRDYQADEQALKDALAIARNATSGEVFIFHQKPERKILGIFPKKDRQYYHFVHGKLQQEGKYSPSDGGFSQEGTIYGALVTHKATRNFLFYFGHEIPTFADQSYHSSQPKQIFNTEVYSDHISKFSCSFDLTILATCNNGSPKMMDALSGKTDFVVASPQNLHLSYFSLDKLSLLEENPAIDTELLADSIAENSFSVLSSKLQTMVTVGVYDLSVINDYSKKLASEYDRYLQNVSAKPRFTDNIDCFTIPELKPFLKSSGVKLYYSSPAFGRKANISNHSGWGCKE